MWRPVSDTPVVRTSLLNMQMFTASRKPCCGKGIRFPPTCVRFWFECRGRRRRGCAVPKEAVLSSGAAESVCGLLLVVVLAFAVVRPRGWPEAVPAVPAVAVVVLIGAVPAADAWAETRRLLPVVGFLAAVLALARLCADEGLFTAAGAAVAWVCGDHPDRLLAGVFAVAAVTTAVLSLDATVVLLTPVVFASHSYANPMTTTCSRSWSTPWSRQSTGPAAERRSCSPAAHRRGPIPNFT
jgi:hypothetical protein